MKGHSAAVAAFLSAGLLLSAGGGAVASAAQNSRAATLSVATANEVTETIAATDDATFWGCGVTCDVETGTNLWIGNGDLGTSRAAITFGLESIPPGAEVLSAELELQHTGFCVIGHDGCAEAPVLDVHRITAPWSSSSATATGDYDETTEASLLWELDPVLTWDVTNLVRDWLAFNSPNYGVLVKSDESSQSNGPRVYGFRTGDPELGPRLIITYADDEGSEAPWEGYEPGDGPDELPGGGGDGYDPSDDGDSACDAYTDLGLADGCLPAEAFTDPATDVSATEATLNGRVHPHGSGVTYWFEWEGGGAAGSTPERLIDEGHDLEITVAEALGNLAAGTQWSFRLVARDEGGANVYGDWETFQTSSCGSCTPAPGGPTVISWWNSAPVEGERVAATDPMDPVPYNGCSVQAVFWAVGGASRLIDALKTAPLPASCGHYYIAVQPGSSSEAAQRVPICLVGERASWPANFHAAPVFHWAAWAAWVREEPSTRNWYKAGLAFRAAMSDGGCTSTDRWFINELFSSWFGSDYSETARRQVRARIVNVLRGLYNGGVEGGRKGFTADILRHHGMTALGPYKSALKTAYGAHNFWRAVRLYTEGWSKEVYNRCDKVCTGQAAATIANQGVNNFSFHQRFLALAAPSMYAPVKTTLAETYSPLLSAFWNSDTDAYRSKIALGQMARLIRQQIYSARLAAEYRYGSGGRIGFTWKDTAFNSASISNADAAERLGLNLAFALRDAFKAGGTPGGACVDSDGAGTLHVGCRPTRTGAAYNTAWNAFKDW